MSTYSLADGGYVVIDNSSSSQTTVQKYDASGQAVGQAATEDGSLQGFAALSNGGYVLVDASSIYLHDEAYVFGGQGGSPTKSFEVGGVFSANDIAAAPSGGFLITSTVFAGHQIGPSPVVAAYDNAGNQIAAADYLAAYPSMSVDNAGDYEVAIPGWSPLVVDPANPGAALTPPPPITSAIVGYDGTGAFQSGATVADYNLSFRVPVSGAGGVEVIYTTKASYGGAAETSHQFTASEISQGYADISIGFHDAGQHTLHFRPISATGLLGQSTDFSVAIQSIVGIDAPQPKAEGDSGTTDFVFTVFHNPDNVNAADVDYYLAYGGTADSADFAGPTAGTVHFGPSDSFAYVHIAVNGDTTVEPDETFTLALANPRGANIQSSASGATATILNDDSSGGSSGGGGSGSPALSITAPAPTHEGTSGTTDFAFTVTRSGDASSSALVDYYLAYGGTADGSDFAGPTAGTVSFDAGQTTATIHVAVAGDTLAEGDETFVIALANGRGADIDSSHGSATATILDGAGSSSGGASGSGSSVTTSDANYTAPAGVRDITLTGYSSQTVHANNEGDTIHSNNNGNTIFGGTGDDTVYVGRNGDVIAGGGGNDTYVFIDNPWSRSGVISDFNAGDVIDLTPMLHKAGYVSGDPVAEGYLEITPNNPPSSQIWFNPDPQHSSTFWFVTSLTGVSPSSLHDNGGLITV